MATLTERLAIIVEANAGKAIAEFKTLGNTTKGLSGDVGKAGGALSKLGGSLGSIVGALGPEAAIAAGGVALAKFAADGVTAFVSLAGEVKEFRRVAGGTAEDASRLVAAFSAVGVDATTASTGVFQLEKHLASGADKLRAFGVTAQKDAKGNTDMSATLLSLADAYKRIHDPIQRAALLTAAFGKSGTALIPLLSKSREEIKGFFDEAEKHHEILSDDDLKKATDYKLAVHDLSEAWKGLGREVGAEVVPVLTTIARDVSDIIGLVDKAKKQYEDFVGSHPGAKVTDPLEQLGGALPKHGLLGQFLPDDWYKKLADWGILSQDTAQKTATLGPAFAAIGDAIAGVTPKIEADTAAMDSLDKALSNVTDADHALQDAHQNTIDAQAALNKLQKDGAVDAQKVADATRSLADANRSVGHAQREQADAQQAYNEALAAFTVLGTDTAADKLHDATNNLADANDSLAGAQDRAKAAGEALTAAKAGDPEYQQKLADAKQHVADATLAESQRALASVTAWTAEAAALKESADQAQALFDKYQALIKQHPEVALALAGNLSALGLALPPAPPPPPPAPILGPPVPSGGPVKTVTFNNTFQVPVDPAAIARQFIWGLN